MIHLLQHTTGYANYGLSFIDFVMYPSICLIILIVVFFISSKSKDAIVRKHFFSFFFVKVLCMTLFGLLYEYYYHGGDTYNYFAESYVLTEMFYEEPLAVLKFYFSTHEEALQFMPSEYSTLHYVHAPASGFVIKSASLFNLITFSTYFSTSLFFTLFSSMGIWFLFRTVLNIYPKIESAVALSILYVPSMLFWGSGLMKDTIVVGSMGFLVHYFHEIFFKSNRQPVNLIYILTTVYVIYIVKIYVLICLVPCLFIWYFLVFQHKIKNNTTRIFLKPILFSIALVIGVFSVNKLTESDERYSLDKIESTAQETSSYIYRISQLEGGSAYSIGDISFTPTNIPFLILKAVNVTIYRPYLWEIKNVVMAIASIESLFFFGFTLLIFYKKGTKHIFKTISGDPFLLSMFIYAISFSFSVGMTSFNFGALSRYKIPMLPFFCLILVCVYLKPKKKKLTKA